MEVSQRPKFESFFSSMLIEEILEKIHQYSIFIKVNSKIDACRDKKDNFLLSLAKDGNADYLLTADYDLLEMNKFENTLIMTITDFLQKKF